MSYAAVMTNSSRNMERPLRNIVFLALKNDIDFDFGLKISFSIFVAVIIVMGLIVHRRILSFLSRNTGISINVNKKIKTYFS